MVVSQGGGQSEWWSVRVVVSQSGGQSEWWPVKWLLTTAVHYTVFNVPIVVTIQYYIYNYIYDIRQHYMMYCKD